MSLSLEEVKESIASLTGHQPFQLLLQHLDATAAHTLNDLALCKTDKETLQVSRRYQTQVEYLTALKTIPESFVQDNALLQKEADEAGVGEEYDYEKALPRHRANMLRKIEEEKGKL